MVSTAAALIACIAFPVHFSGARRQGAGNASPEDRFHRGHRAEIVTRLHRIEGASESAMIEAEARWEKIGDPMQQLPSKRHSFVKVSSDQLRALRDYHRMSALVQVSESVSGLNASGTMHGHGHRLVVHAAQANLGDDIPITHLERMSSQYVGPVGVGTVAQPEGCESKLKDAGSLVFIPRDSDEAGAANSSMADVQTCHTSEQTHVHAVLDTGSTNIWIASDLCKEGPCAKPERSRYDHTRSATFHEPTAKSLLHIKFGTGEVSGPQAEDDFHIGPFTVYKQTFGMIQEEQGSVFEQVPFEGIVGLGFPRMSANGVTPFFDNIINQKVLKNNEFSFYFSRDDPSANAILWGGVDHQFHQGDIEFFPVVEPYYWSLKLKSFKIGDEELPVGGEARRGSLLDLGKRRVSLASAAADGARAIVDTGTTYFTAQNQLYSKIMQRLPAAPCNQVTSKSHPDITYTLETVGGEDRDFVLNNMQYMVSDRGQDGECSPAFMEINVPAEHGPAMILGEVFLRHYFSVFDRVDGTPEKARVGFAKAKHGDEIDTHLKDLTKHQAGFTPRSGAATK